MSSRKIIKAISIISLGTVISRVFGLAREIITANFFGTTSIYDAFLLAFMIPNFFRGILAEGALNSAFIPVFTEYLSDEKKRAETGKIVNLCFTLSIILTLSLFFLIFLFSYIAENFVNYDSRWFWVFILIKFTFPYLIFISLAALNMGILNSYKHFLLPSFSPVVLDIFWILSLFFLIPLFGTTLEEKIFGLCFGVIGGGIGQFIFMLPAVKKMGYRLRLNFNFNHPAIKKMGKLLAPVIIGVAVVPINLLVDYSLANFLYEGAVSGLWYATRIFQLPLGVFAISISTAVLPWFSENISEKKYEEFQKNLLFSIKLLLLLMVPFTFGLIFFRKEFVSFLFQRGMFTLHSVYLVSFPLTFYSIGLVGYGGASIFTRAFYASGDTKTPVKVGILSIFTNFIFDIILMKFLKHGGIALSTSIVGFFNFFLLIYFFNRKHQRINIFSLSTFFIKILISSLIMLGVIYFYKIKISTIFSLPLFLLTGIILAGTVYFFCIKLFVFKKGI